MCYSGTCEFENHMGDCMTFSPRYFEAQKIAKKYDINVCAIGGFAQYDEFLQTDKEFNELVIKARKELD